MNSTSTALAEALEANGEAIDKLISAVREIRTDSTKAAVGQIQASYFDPAVRVLAGALLDRWDWAWIVEAFEDALT
jgi:hypothetical protein